MKWCMGCMAEIGEETKICPHCGYAKNTRVKEAYYLSPETMLHDRYIVGRVLGYGGFGVTYIGYDTVIGSVTAIKEYFPSDFATRGLGSKRMTIYPGDAQIQYQSGLESFISEARKLARFTETPGIVDIYDCFLENDTGYIVMEYLRGKTVKEILKEKERFSYEEAERIILRVLDGLSAVHKEGIIHRDVAPDNIFITDNGDVKLLDFGAARYAASIYSRSLSVILKPGYAPEEQYRSRGQQGSWTDVYGAGATFYRMITGVRPEESLERMLEDTLEAPSKLGIQIPPEKEAVLMKSLAVRRGNRIQTAEEFKNLLVPSRDPVTMIPGTNKAAPKNVEKAAAKGSEKPEAGKAAPKSAEKVPAKSSEKPEAGKAETKGMSSAADRPVPKSTEKSADKPAPEKSGGSTLKMVAVLGILLGIALIAWAVWGGGSMEEPAGSTAVVETEAETVIETDDESEVITEAEPGSEQITENESETVRETESEAVTETETDTDAETASETEAVSETEQETEAVTETESETESETETAEVTEEPETEARRPSYVNATMEDFDGEWESYDPEWLTEADRDSTSEPAKALIKDGVVVWSGVTKNIYTGIMRNGRLVQNDGQFIATYLDTEEACFKCIVSETGEGEVFYMRRIRTGLSDEEMTQAFLDIMSGAESASLTVDDFEGEWEQKSSQDRMLIKDGVVKWDGVEDFVSRCYVNEGTGMLVSEDGNFMAELYEEGENQYDRYGSGMWCTLYDYNAVRGASSFTMSKVKDEVSDEEFDAWLVEETKESEKAEEVRTLTERKETPLMDTEDWESFTGKWVQYYNEWETADDSPAIMLVRGDTVKWSDEENRIYECSLYGGGLMDVENGEFAAWLLAEDEDCISCAVYNGVEYENFFLRRVEENVSEVEFAVWPHAAPEETEAEAPQEEDFLDADSVAQFEGEWEQYYDGISMPLSEDDPDAEPARAVIKNGAVQWYGPNELVLKCYISDSGALQDAEGQFVVNLLKEDEDRLYGTVWDGWNGYYTVAMRRVKESVSDAQWFGSEEKESELKNETEPETELKAETDPAQTSEDSAESSADASGAALVTDDTCGTYVVTSADAALNLDAAAQDGTILLPEKACVYISVSEEKEDGTWRKGIYAGIEGWIKSDCLTLLSKDDLSIKVGDTCYANTTPGSSDDLLNVYETNSATSVVLAVAEYGEEFVVEDFADNWAKVTLAGKTGWVQMNQIAKFMPECYYYATAGSGLRMRQLPDTGATAVGTLYIGNTVKLAECVNGWGRVQEDGEEASTGDSKAREGKWVAMKYMTPCMESDGGKQFETEAPAPTYTTPSYSYSSGSSSSGSKKSSGGSKKSSGGGFSVADIGSF